MFPLLQTSFEPTLLKQEIIFSITLARGTFTNVELLYICGIDKNVTRGPNDSM